MAVLHIPSGGVAINGVVYLAEGAGTHPTMVLLHGLPGNEKNLDLAQAVRRAGWNVITFNYRGSWGSPGQFSFGGTLEDVRAVLAFVRDPGNARTYGIDTSRIVLAGHSMGGWDAAMAAEEDSGVAGTIVISGVDTAELPSDHSRLVSVLSKMMETLNVTPEGLATEIEKHREALDWRLHSAALARKPLLVLTADDRFAAAADQLVGEVRAVQGARVTTLHVATDHGWSDARIRLEDAVLDWLGQFRKR
jgi:pimeloyl-ACP methyl ester carboxylesterase